MRVVVAALGLLLQAVAQEEADVQALAVADCQDRADECAFWASHGECDSNPVYMLSECAKSCGCREQPAAVPQPQQPAEGDPACVDKDKSGACAHWASLGECENNAAFMKLKCASSCGTCDMLDYKKRCPMPANRTPAVLPNTMSDTFQRAITEFAALEPVVLSRDPWVVSFERFLSPDEVRALTSPSP
jgi:prolyl 4-hydroxylase